VACAVPAQAVIILGPNGQGGLNAYELVSSPQANWGSAKTASQIAFPGIPGVVGSSATVGHLATITSATESATIQTINVGNPWVGLTDQAGDAPGAFEGGNQTNFPVPAQGSTPVAGERGFGWAWVTGEPLVFHNWNGTGEPNGGAGESHVQLTDSGAWNDLNAGSVRNYIREWDLNVQAADVLPDGGGFNSETFRRTGNAAINNLAEADDAINNGVLVGSGTAGAVNYFEPGGGGGTGNFPGDIEPFGLSAGADDDFTVRSTGFLQILEDGNFQFRNNTDDGSRLRIDLNGNGVFDAGETVILDDVLSGPHNADSAVLALLEGQYLIEHTWFERSGGAEGDLGVSRNGSPFFLLGDPQGDGMSGFFGAGAFVTTAAIVPEPATAMLAMLGVALLGSRRRRNA
jgi:MYXO-CTERM domain-containing protein